MKMTVDEAHSHECDHYGRTRERLEMVARRGSTLHPTAAEQQKQDEEKSSSQQWAEHQNSKKRTRPINICGVWSAFWNSIIYVCFQHKNFGKKLHLVQTAEPCETVMRR